MFSLVIIHTNDGCRGVYLKLHCMNAMAKKKIWHISNLDLGEVIF